MFIKTNNVYRSTVLDTAGVYHAFSTRLGGVSKNPDIGSMNVAPNHGDSSAVVRRNIDILAEKVGCTAGNCVCTHQIHSEYVTFANREHCGLGVDRPNPRECDGFYTSHKDVMLMVRTADCTPILLCGIRENGEPAVCAIHAGWRGAAKGIAFAAVGSLNSLGLRPKDIRAAIGPRALFEDFEVGEDMRDTVLSLAGKDITDKFIRMSNGKLHADIGGINREFLLMAGVADEHIDMCDISTVQNPGLFHSHRRSGDNRGAMGNVIVIK